MRFEYRAYGNSQLFSRAGYRMRHVIEFLKKVREGGTSDKLGARVYKQYVRHEKGGEELRPSFSARFPSLLLSTT